MKYLVLAIALALTIGFGAKYPTAEAKTYESVSNPHQGKLFGGCICCHQIVC